MEIEILFLLKAGIGLFIFWFLVGAIEPQSDSIRRPIGALAKPRQTLVMFFMVAGFVWFFANLILPVLQGWLIPPEWVSYSFIFWWISFIAGLSGLVITALLRSKVESKKP